MATIGVPFEIKLKGTGFQEGDRIRIVDVKTLCGSSKSRLNAGTVLKLAAPVGAPSHVDYNHQSWANVQVLDMGIFKVCWCAASSGCTEGEHFFNVAGYVVSV
jgi:hypothetical protein